MLLKWGGVTNAMVTQGYRLKWWSAWNRASHPTLSLSAKDAGCVPTVEKIQANCSSVFGGYRSNETSGPNELHVLNDRGKKTKLEVWELALWVVSVKVDPKKTTRHSKKIQTSDEPTFKSGPLENNKDNEMHYLIARGMSVTDRESGVSGTVAWLCRNKTNKTKGVIMKRENPQLCMVFVKLSNLDSE